MKFVVDSSIPFIEGVFEPWATVVYKHGNEINHLFTQLDTISVHLAKQDSASQRIIGARDFRRESPLEAGEQTVFNIA